MRFAAIADVHGNALALEAVLDDIRSQGISDIVNLGDALASCLSMIFSGKPVSTFPDHALGE
jgi:predicted phosphodiesterase